MASVEEQGHNSKNYTLKLAPVVFLRLKRDAFNPAPRERAGLCSMEGKDYRCPENTDSHQLFKLI